MSAEISEELNLSRPGLLHPSYKYRKLVPIEGSSDVTLAVSQGNVSTFELPSGAMNLSKSYLTFTATPTAGGANNYNWEQVNCLAHIDSIEFLNRQGTSIFNIREVSHYTKLVWLAETKVDDFLTFPVSVGSHQNKLLHKINDTKSALKRADGQDYETAYIEPKQAEPGTVNAATPVLRAQIDLKMLYNTLCEQDIDIDFNETMIFKIYWNQANKILWYGTSATDPSAGAAQTAGALTLGSLSMYIAYEKNPEIIAKLKSQIMGDGVNILYQTYAVFKKNIPATGNVSVSCKLNRGHGISLRRIYSSIFNTTETYNNMYDHSNRSSGKLTSYNSSIDGQRLQEFTVNCGTSGQDYLINKAHLNGSLILSCGQYDNNWFHVDRFEEEVPLPVKNDENSQGIDLSLEKEYMFEFAAASAGNHYCFAIVQKLMRITKEGIQVI